MRSDSLINLNLCDPHDSKVSNGARTGWAPSSAWNTEAGGGNPTAKDHAAVSARSTASRSRSMTMR
jgi:hypothetical protein